MIMMMMDGGMNDDDGWMNDNDNDDDRWINDDDDGWMDG